ncbi:MAG: putative bifunctional diguanylate cyclase/phosphodiesterase [Candidatus Berkiella sp.]
MKSLSFQSKISLYFVLLLLIVQICTLFVIYWADEYFNHAMTILDFIAIAIIASTILLSGSLLILKKVLLKLKDREATLLFQSQHDPITKLPNRVYFLDFIQQKLESNEEQPFGLVTIGIDRFPQFNQALGYQIGDRLLNHVAGRLTSNLNQAQIIARLASNVFIALIPDLTQKNYSTLVEKILEIFSTPFSVYTVQIDLDVLLGFSFYPQDGHKAAPLIQKADLALYAARYSVDRCVHYQEEHDPHHHNKISLMSELREGLSQDEFQVFYQPKVDLKSNHITHVEALIRWFHPTRGDMSPDQFIPLAEETGHLKNLTLWLLEKSIIQAKIWQSESIALGISVNLSVKDLLNKKLPIYIASLLKEHGTNPSLITLEITESAFMREPQNAIIATHRLIQLGVKLSIDDYGTGYSSLNYLKELPLHELKLDKSFIQDMLSKQRTAHIVQSTIRLAHSLGMHVVAEGINDEHTVKMLRHFGCDQGQGFYFSQPLSLTELSKWLHTSPFGFSNS